MALAKYMSLVNEMRAESAGAPLFLKEAARLRVMAWRHYEGQ